MLALGTLCPRLRPRDPVLERWLDDREPGEPTRELLEAALAQISGDELNTMARRYAAEHPEAWRGIVDELGDAETAARLLGVGAVGAALREERRLRASDLELIEDVRGLREDALEVLARVVEPCDLWSLVEATETAAALAGIPPTRCGEAVAGEASSRWTDDHRARLDLLVERVRRQLPLDGRPLASAALGAACAAYASDARVRDTLPALLLEDALPAAGLFADLAA